MRPPIPRTVAAPRDRRTATDKPTIIFAPPADPDRVAHELTIRVPDCRAAHATLTARGAIFLAAPSESDWEIRAFFRDPDGHLLEISQAK